MAAKNICLQNWIKNSEYLCLSTFVTAYSSITEKFTKEEKALSRPITTVSF